MDSQIDFVNPIANNTFLFAKLIIPLSRDISQLAYSLNIQIRVPYLVSKSPMQFVKVTFLV